MAMDTQVRHSEVLEARGALSQSQNIETLLSRAEGPCFAKLVAGLVDPEDRFERLQYEEWLRKAKSRGRDDLRREVVAAVTSEAAIKALAVAQAAIIKAEAAEDRARLAYRKAAITVDEHEPIDPATDWSLRIVSGGNGDALELLLVESQKTVQRKAFSELFQFARGMAEASVTELQAIRGGELPAEAREVLSKLEEDSGYDLFLVDLADLLCESDSGQEGRKIVRLICESRAVAKQYASSEMAKPLKALASMALKESEEE